MSGTVFSSASQIRHAYIVSGADSESCFEEAIGISMAAVCRSEGRVPCCSCPACIKAKAGKHPDVRVIERLRDDKGKLKREVTVGQIREVSTDAVVLPNEAQRKVYIIKDAQFMNREAQNAALKLLEEPPAGVIFILCATSPMALLQTVRSRCVEIIAGSSDRMQDPETLEEAEQFLKTAASGDELALYRFCEERNGMSIQEAAEFVQAVRETAAEMLCGREPNPGIEAKRLMYIELLMEKCAAYLQVNVNVKQLLGLIEADALKQDF